MEKEKILATAGRAGRWAFALVWGVVLTFGLRAGRVVSWHRERLARNPSFRQGFLVGLGWAMGAFALVWAGTQAWDIVDDMVSQWKDEGTSEDPVFTGTQLGTPAYVAKVRAERAKIRGFNSDILPFVEDEYNAYVGSSSWRAKAHACFAHMREFEEASALTLYPAELLAGVALHESAGCNMGASDRAGGRGWMQLTHISRARHVAPVGKMLHVPMEQVAFNMNTTHNLLTGVMVLDDYERTMGSRERGLLAYNMGPGGVKKAMRKYGWKPGERKPTVAQLRPFLRNDNRARPRLYVPRVLAAAVMMRRLALGKELEPVRNIRPSDVPGWKPAQDGATWRAP